MIKRRPGVGYGEILEKQVQVNLVCNSCEERDTSRHGFHCAIAVFILQSFMGEGIVACS